MIETNSERELGNPSWQHDLVIYIYQSKNYNRRRLRRWSSTSLIHLPKMNLCCIATGGTVLYAKENKTGFMCFKPKNQPCPFKCRACDISRPVQQYLINWKQCKHMHSEGIDCCWHIIDHYEIWSVWLYKIVLLPSNGCVCNAVGMHHLDAHEKHKEKANGNYTKILHAVLNRSWK